MQISINRKLIANKKEKKKKPNKKPTKHFFLTTVFHDTLSEKIASLRKVPYNNTGSRLGIYYVLPWLKPFSMIYLPLRICFPSFTRSWAYACLGADRGQGNCTQADEGMTWITLQNTFTVCSWVGMIIYIFKTVSRTEEQCNA